MINEKKIELFTLCYNEEVILPFFLKHYSKFVDKITVFDNQSTDNSLKILKEYKEIPITTNTYETNNKLDDKTYINIKNNCWKNSEFDYVIICDTDEFLHFDKFDTSLDILTPNGYEMVDNIELDKIDTIKYGLSEKNYNKTILFNPKKITEINYSFGCHTCNPIPNNLYHVVNDDNYKILHYKYINLEYVYKKYYESKNRLSDFNQIHKLGIQYNWDNNQINSYYNMINSKKIKLL